MRVALGAALLAGVFASAATPALASPSLGSWNSTSLGAAQAGVSCPSAGLCVAVGSTTAYVNTAPITGTTWQGQATGAAGLDAVSCAPGSAFCVAVGAAGAVVVNSSTGSGSWTALPAQDSGHTLTSVSCPSTSFCLAVDGSSGGAIYSTTEGATWTSVSPGHTLSAVSCGSAGQCAGVDASHIYASTSPTSNASFTQVAPTDANALKDVACAANNTCVAVDGSGYAWASGDANAATQTWSETPIAGSLSAVACTPSGVCVAAGSGTAYASDNPTAANPSWASSTLAASPPMGVACADQGLCAAVDGAGNAYVSTLPAPSATTGSGSAITQTSATLNATVNPADAALTNCTFEYGPTTSYGSSVPCSSTPSPTGGTQAVSAQITGLSAGTTYHFQIVATNAIGSSGGGDQSLTTQTPVKPSPSITGIPAVGDTLTCALGVSVPAGASASYTWVRDTTAIAGATGATYIVVTADQTHHLYCTATISGDGGSASGGSGYVSVASETLGTVFETVVGAASAAARTVTVPVTCSPQAVSACVITLSLTDGRPHHTVTVGRASSKIAVGAKTNVTVALNSRGRSLLAHNRHLKVTLTVTGTIIGVVNGTLKRQTITFSAAHHARRR